MRSTRTGINRIPSYARSRTSRVEAPARVHGLTLDGSNAAAVLTITSFESRR